ncbi:MAG: NAD(P)H-dependent oxidoreductase subunit E, partial [Acidiferrobacterales bacterium]
MLRHTAEVKKFRHPGSSRRHSPIHPKGRQVDDKALEEIQTLLGERPRRRDLLIEHLHLIQDRHGCVSAPHLVALAAEMRLPLAEVYEVATFYAHFDIVEDGHTQPSLTVRVCDSLTCEMMGAQKLLAELSAKLGSDVRVVRAPCMGRCDTAPVAEVGHYHADHATVETVSEAVRAGHVHPEMPSYNDYQAYVAADGYKVLRECQDGKRQVDDVIGILENSALRGLGGAGFPTGRKWRIVRGYAGPRLLAVNADEGEPGTFKDRYYLERDPHRFLEGMLIAAWAVEAEAVYIYLRDEYPAIRDMLLTEIPKLEAAGLAADTKIDLRRGA